jgi:hypothetical protein
MEQFESLIELLLAKRHDNCRYPVIARLREQAGKR